METVSVKIIPSSRSDGFLLWAPGEKHLYFKKCTHKNKTEDWICYQEMIAKSQKDVVPCTSRLLVDRSTLTATRKRIPHSEHENHEMVFKDLQSRTKINDECIQLKKLCEGLSMDVRAQDIFTRELASLVSIFNRIVLFLFLFMYRFIYLFVCQSS